MDIFIFDQEIIKILILLCLAGMLSGFIDSIVGGGGLISVPAILLTGLEPSLALGTNKAASTIAAATSSYIFLKSGKVNVNIVKKQLPFTLIGSVLGTLLVISIPPLILKPLLIVLLISVLILVNVKKDWGSENNFSEQKPNIILYAILFAFVIGAYDGFIGPGTGTFLIFAFVLMGFDFITAAGNAKILNFASNFASVVVFLIMGKIFFLYSLGMAVGQFIGAFFGSRLAIKKGSSLVRIVFLVVTTTMICKLGYDYIKVLFN